MATIAPRDGWTAPWPATIAMSRAVLAFAIVIGTVGRVVYNRGAPLWLDETFSAVIATQTDVAALVRWCLTELTGPAFYMPLWAWQQLAGSSDLALRIPSLLCSLAAPLMIQAWGHRDPALARYWAVAAWLWVPAMTVATEARPYPLLFLLGALQAIAFVKTMRDPTPARAFGWAAASATLLLTHYFSGVIVAVQGAMLLAIHWRALPRCWASVLPFGMAAAWMAVHMPFVTGYAAAQAPHYAPAAFGWREWAAIPALVVGVPLHGFMILLIIVASLVAFRKHPRFGVAAWRPEILLAISGIASFGLLFSLGFFEAGVAARYYTPVMPAVLFAGAFWARGMVSRGPHYVQAVTAILALVATGIVAERLTRPSDNPRHLFNLAQPSDWLAETAPRRVVFLWDSPAGQTSGADHLAEVAGFSLRRSGHPVTVTTVRAPARSDPNPLLLEAAGNDPRTAILWISADRLSPLHTPRIAQHAGWTCRDFGGDGVTSLACRRSAGALR